MTTDRTATPPVRRHDPCARRMIDVVIRLERAPWPAAMRAYGAMLVALSVRCERHRAAKGEVYRWMTADVAGYLHHRDALTREVRADALADIATEIAGLLLRFRAGLDPKRRPNLRSMLRAAFVWRARQDMESIHGRHRRREGPALRDDDRARASNARAATLAREVIDMLDRDDPAHQALMLVGLGLPVAEAARRTGASRQQVYRARDALRAMVDSSDD